MPIYRAFLFGCQVCGKSEFVALPAGTGLKDAAGTLNDEGWDIAIMPHDIDCHEYCPNCKQSNYSFVKAKKLDDELEKKGYGFTEGDGFQDNLFGLKKGYGLFQNPPKESMLNEDEMQDEMEDEMKWLE